MQFNLEHDNTINLIQRFENNIITVRGKDYPHNIVVTPQTILNDWTQHAFSQLVEQDFNVIFEIKPEIVLLGCGEKQQHLPTKLLPLFIQQGIGVEVMTNIAACRTYNILASEGRNTAVAFT